MASLTDRARSVYLILLILFLIALGFAVFDYFQIINAEEYFPFLKKKPAPVQLDDESPTELDKLEFQKSRERLADQMDNLDSQKKELEIQKQKLEAEMERLEELQRGLKQKEKALEEASVEQRTRKERIRVMADKVANMPPQSAVQMLENWPDNDIIDVFIQMDQNAADEGRQTITTYLLTLFPADRRALITNKWLSRSPDTAFPDVENQTQGNP